jgi:hypothetical protein
MKARTVSILNTSSGHKYTRFLEYNIGGEKE